MLADIADRLILADDLHQKKNIYINDIYFLPYCHPVAGSEKMCHSWFYVLVHAQANAVWRSNRNWFDRHVSASYTVSTFVRSKAGGTTKLFMGIVIILAILLILLQMLIIDYFL